MESGWIGLFSAVAGGIGVKLVDHILNRQSQAFKDAKVIRDELRGELNQIRKELAAHKLELETWRGKYYQLLQENLAMEKHVAKLETDIADLRSTFDSVSE